MTPRKEDSFPEHSTTGDIVVSAAEHRKMMYLIESKALFDGAYQDFKSLRYSAAFTDGVMVDARIDWRQVAIHCAPQVLVLLMYDKTGSVFEDHPLFAILPESGQSVFLPGVTSVSIEESDDRKREVDVQGILNSLLSHVDTIDGGKRLNAKKQIQILQRILR